MPLLHALVLGLVQGLTEFIPISSSGHLVLVPAAFGWDQPGLSFDVLLHVASLLALLVYFSGDLIDLTRGTIAGDERARRTVGLLAIASVPAAIAGLALGDLFEDSFQDARSSAVQLVFTALILVAGELVYDRHRTRATTTGGRLKEMDTLRTQDAAAIGFAQAVSILPGISRSGATIATGLALGAGREAAARFAFLLAIPALFGAAVVKMPDLDLGSLGWGSAAGGFLASLVTSYAAIAVLIRYLKTNTLYPFAAYCVVAGVVFFLIV